ncbi:hypothetical protein [Streptomyces sp. 7N604]|uniref:hypothetical protein n=1 Tax=Streptomyces sp. 7N604 TaxID=3457415 RepID=UPI003FD6ACCD
MCAPSVWSALVIRCAKRYGQAHFQDSMGDVADDGLVTVVLAGVELSELVETMYQGSRWWSREDAAGRALCRTVYEAVAAVLDQVDLREYPAPWVPPIVISAGAAGAR